MVLRLQKDGLLVVASVLCDFVMKHSPASYREFVVGTSRQARLSESTNEQHRIYLVAEPLPRERGTEIESGTSVSKTGPRSAPISRGRQFNWDENVARKYMGCRIWCCLASRMGWKMDTRGISFNRLSRCVRPRWIFSTLAGRLCQEQCHASRPSLVEETAAALHASFSFGLDDTVTLGSASMTP